MHSFNPYKDLENSAVYASVSNDGLSPYKQELNTLLQVLYSNFNSKGVKEREDTLGSSPLGAETIRRIGD